MPLRTLVALWNKGNSVLKRHLLYFISRTTPFQNPATARTADSRERTGAAKAPVCSPAILSIDRFALDSGGKRVPTAANDLRHTVPARVASLLWGQWIPPQPHSPRTAARMAKQRSAVFVLFFCPSGRAKWVRASAWNCPRL